MATDAVVRSTLRPGFGLLALLSLLAVPWTARALPSFAQQTGMPCAQCHTVAFGPALTPYGREFKLNGYVFGDAGSFLPLTLMMQGGYTHTRADQPDSPAPHTSTNANLSLDQTSLFYAGRLTEHSGAFVQVTYSGADRKTEWDNMDVRYARPLTFGNTALVVGVSLNNNPTVQDLWNSTAGWGYPYISSALAPAPAAGPMIEALGQTVLGATAYAMINQHLYVEAGGYRGVSDRWLGNVGLSADDSPHVSGVAPYWRAALQFGTGHRQWSVGTFGMRTDVQPDPTLPGTDRYTDVGVDMTFTQSGGEAHALAANVAVTHEHRALDASVQSGASDAASNQLTAFRADLTYAYQQTWVGSVSVFNTSGTANGGLFAPEPLNGSSSASPDSRGYTLQLEWIPFGKMSSYMRPWLNVRTGLQYVGYTKFNGGTTNYDGFGRSARDNNTLFAYLWVIS
jgi:hypothetical protein